MNAPNPPGEGGHASLRDEGKPFSAYTYTQTHPRLAAGLGAAFLGGLLFAALLSRPDARHAVEAGAPSSAAAPARARAAWPSARPPSRRRCAATRPTCRT